MDNEIIDNLKPKTFHVIRQADESGVSGTGKVIDGIVWANGWTQIFWRTDLDIVKRGNSSITFFESFDAFEKIHISSHPTNKTIIVWDDDELAIATAELEETTEELKTCKDKLKNVRKELRELKAELQDEVCETTDEEV